MNRDSINFTNSILNNWYWPAHIYSIPVIWAIVGINIFITGINIKPRTRQKELLARSCLNLGLVCGFRIFYMLGDPYELRHRFPVSFSRVVYIAPLPIFLAGFFYQIIALMKIIGITPRPYLFGNGVAIQIISIAWSVVLSLLEILVQWFPQRLFTLSSILHILFNAWQATLCVMFLFHGRSMLHKLRKSYPGNSRKYKFTKSNGTQMDMQIPQIRITDENDQSHSLHSAISWGLEGGDIDMTQSTLNQSIPDLSDVESSSCIPDADVNAIEHVDQDKQTEHLQENEETRDGEESTIETKRRRKTKEHKKNNTTKVKRLIKLVQGSYLSSVIGLLLIIWNIIDWIARTSKWYNFTSYTAAFIILTCQRMHELIWMIILAVNAKKGFARLT